VSHADHGWTAGVAARARRYWTLQLAAAGELPCCRCGGLVHVEDAWDVDHVIPLSQDGELGLDNQAISHRPCNRRHGQGLAHVAAAVQSAAERGIRPW
jgi:5-methylcytosine-specific restriction endonuclease McrA